MRSQCDTCRLGREDITARAAAACRGPCAASTDAEAKNRASSYRHSRNTVGGAGSDRESAFGRRPDVRRRPGAPDQTTSVGMWADRWSSQIGKKRRELIRYGRHSATLPPRYGLGVFQTASPSSDVKMERPTGGVLSDAGRNKPLKHVPPARQIRPIWLRIREGAPNNARFPCPRCGSSLLGGASVALGSGDALVADTAQSRGPFRYFDHAYPPGDQPLGRLGIERRAELEQPAKLRERDSAPLVDADAAIGEDTEQRAVVDDAERTDRDRSGGGDRPVTFSKRRAIMLKLAESWRPSP